MNDSEIIALYFSRDESAINQTKIKYGSKLYGLAFKILKSSQDTEECVSDTYLKAWNTIPPQRPEYFFAYIAKICRFICFGRLDYAKALKRDANLQELSDELLECVSDKGAEAQLSELEFKTALNEFLQSLAQESRVIFMRRYWFCESVEEIATGLKITKSKTKTSLQRTREKLKIYLSKEGINL